MNDKKSCYEIGILKKENENVVKKILMLSLNNSDLSQHLSIGLSNCKSYLKMHLPDSRTFGQSNLQQYTFGHLLQVALHFSKIHKINDSFHFSVCKNMCFLLIKICY